MYAIGSNARHKTETAGKIALGIKARYAEEWTNDGIQKFKYLMFHYWSNSKAYLLTKGPILVSRDNVPSEYLIRIEKDAVKYLLLDYYSLQSANMGNVNVLKIHFRS